MTYCDVCGSACAEGANYCSACGHRLGQPAGVVCRQREPQEPTAVNVRVVNSSWDTCLSCFGTAVGVIVIVFVISWLISSC